MTKTARLERLERKVQVLEHRVSRVAPTPEEERIRARRLVLDHLRKHKTIDGVKLAVKHDLFFGDVQEALNDLEKLGSVGRAED